MIEKICKFLENIGEEYETAEDEIMVRKVDENFSIDIDGVTIFFNNRKNFNTYTLIEVCKRGNYEAIGFRTKKDLHQTGYTAIRMDKCKDIEYWRINGEYKYIE